MPEAKTLAVGVAILTILGMTVALAVPLGPSLAGDDDPENSGVTSAQEDPTNNTNNSTDDNSTNTDNDPEDNDENGGADTPPCESNDDSSDSSDSSDCGSDGDGANDQHGEKDKDDDGADDGNDGTDSDSGDEGADDQDGKKDKDHGGDGDDTDGTDDNETDDSTDDNETDDSTDDNETDDSTDDNETDVTGTCEEDGLLLNNTLANELFGTENESGPLSEVIHENEHYFMEGGVIFHESGCIVATIDNAAGGGDGGPSDQLPGDNVTDQLPGGENGTDQLPGGENGTDGNETDNGTEGELGTCETGGAIQENTLANELFGTENEDGPISSALHANEAQFQGGEPVVHEVSCGVATVDNNASGGGDLPESP